MHAHIAAAAVRPQPVVLPNTRGFSRFQALDPSTGAVHTDLGICSLQENGSVGLCVQAYEETFYILEGEPVLVLEDRATRLKPGDCGVILTGLPHAWRGGPAPSRWIDNLAPRPRAPAAGAGPDTFFLGPAPDLPVRELDIRDPRNRTLFHMRDRDIDLQYLQRGSSAEEPTVSASMATAVLAYSGIAVKMLVDARLGASQSTSFMVEYQPGAVAHPHDHPLEEAYVILEGEVDVVADNARYKLAPGDIFWTGVGCVHAFYNVSNKRVRWLETSTPQPPLRHSYRFERDWDYLAKQLPAGGA